MKLSTFVAALSVVVLAGCAHMMEHHQQAMQQGQAATWPNPHNPQVGVLDGYVIVDQEPIVIKNPNDREPIVWRLPPNSQYTFADDGIVIHNAGSEFSCNIEPDKHGFRCINAHSKPGRYKYTVKVLDGTKPLEPLDPWIANG